LAIKISSDKKTKKTFVITFVFWWLFWAVLQTSLLQDFGIPTKIAAVDALISIGLLAAVCLLIINNMSYYLPGKERYLYVLIISLTLSGLWLFIVKLILKLIYNPEEAYLASLSQSGGIRYAFAFLMLGCVTMLSILWYTQQEQRENTQRKEDTERLAKDAELNKLRQQLQPHFLFNSLNSISALTGTQPEKARHMIQQLADFLRGTLKKEELQWINLDEELQYVQLYLDIEKVRFGHRLQTEIIYDAEILQMKIPALILQTLVENAIKFGLYDTLDAVTIFIEAKRLNDHLHIAVKNPFDAGTALPTTGTGFGLSSTKRRLFLLFGRQDLLHIKKENNQFITEIIIPQTT
jgi:two-component system, LytTR family, sensor kinase